MKDLPSGPDAWSGQLVRYCNHDAVFEADVIVTPFSVTVIAKSVTGGNVKLFRQPAKVKAAQWHIRDNEQGGYWRPDKGRFILKRDAVSRL